MHSGSEAPSQQGGTGGSVCDGKRCVGVGSIPVLANALSILCGCDSAVSYSGDRKDSRLFLTKTKNGFIYTDLALLVSSGVVSEAGYFFLLLLLAFSKQLEG